MTGFPRNKTFITFLSWALMAYVFVLCAAHPLADPDLWIHLNTGRWMVDNMSLPDEHDPFSYTTPEPIPPVMVVAQRAQWLGQLAFYGVYSASGYPGLAVFRALLALAPFALVMAWAGRKGLPYPAALALTLTPPLLAAVTLYNTYERPQAFSFALTMLVPALVMRLRERSGRSAAPSLAALALVMAIWANLHGGYVVGFGLLTAFALAQAIAMLATRVRPSWARFLTPPPASPAVFFAACAAALAATGLNPSGYFQVQSMAERLLSLLIHGPAASTGAQTVIGGIMEYRPLWFFYTRYGLQWPIFITAFYAVALGAVALRQYVRRRFDPAEAALALTLAAFGLAFAKGVGFALAGLTYLLCRAAIDLRGEGAAGRIALLPTAGGALAALALAAHLALTTPALLLPASPGASGWVDPSYPVQATQFIKEQRIRGPMFNHMRWGGFLAWTSEPQQKVFFDGREINAQTTAMYMSIIRAQPSWQMALMAYDVNYMILPVVAEINGTVSPLILRMVQDRNSRWRPVYVGGNSVVYVLAHERNRRVLQCCSVPSGDLYREILNLSEAMLAVRPGHPDILTTKALALYWSGMYDHARTILQGLPQTPFTSDLLRRVTPAGD